jgi:hypothetical protein
MTPLPDSGVPRALRRALVVPLLAGAALCQNLSNPGDSRPLGETGRPVSIAGSPFEVWIAYPGSMVMFPRIGPPRPRWYGPAQGLPSEGIASLCFDEATQSLWISSSTGRNLRWSQGLESASESSYPAAGCTSRAGRTVAVSELPALMPSQPGWIQSGTDLISPDGLHQRVRRCMVLDGRELWLATDAGIWSGNSATGRITQLPSGLAEACIQSMVRDSSGRSWLLGCEGSLSIADATDRFESTFLPDDPRSGELRLPRLLCPSGPDGIWVSVLEGIQRMDSRGVQDRWFGRRSPFGGRTLSCAEDADTLWCGTQSSVVRKTSSDRSFRADPPPWESASPVFRLLSTPVGLLASTRSGFWWRGPRGWERPPFLPAGVSGDVSFATLEPVEPHRVAWYDGRQVRIDTLPGHGGRPAIWLPDGTPTDLAFDRSGRLHLALSGNWTIWNPATGEHPSWKAGLGLSGDVQFLSPGPDRILLAGPGGSVSVRIAPYAPPATSPR